MRYFFITFFMSVICLITFSANVVSFASPASPGMLDADGCHVCERVCTKFGLKRGQKHCHVFSPEANEAYQRAKAGAATNDETQFGNDAIKALDYISLSEDKRRLIIGPIDKNVEGAYDVVSQSCGFGSGPAIIKNGLSSNADKLFGVKTQRETNGLYTYGLNGIKYPAICVGNKRIIILDKEEHILGAGQFVKKKLYLYCKGSFANAKSIGAKGFCRSSLIRAK